MNSRAPFISILVLTLVHAAYPQQPPAPPMPFALDAPPPGSLQPSDTSAPPYGPTRTEDDYSFLNNPDPRRPKDLFDPIKFIGFLNSQAAYNQGRGREERHTLGAHLSGKRAFGKGSLDYDLEGIIQFGHFDNAGPALPLAPGASSPPPMTPSFFGGNGGPSPAVPKTGAPRGRGSIFAYSVGGIIGYTFESLALKPRLSLQADLGSGDRDPTSRHLGTFNPLFPRGQYFDEASFFDVANLIDFRPALDLHLSDTLMIVVDGIFFWRADTRDGLYSPSNQLLLVDNGSRARYVGSQITGRLVWQFDRHLTFEADYTHLFAGTFLEEATLRHGGGQDIDFFAAWLQLKF
jgi:hypothetical protein